MSLGDPVLALREYRSAEAALGEAKDASAFDPAKIEQARAACAQLAREGLVKAERALIPPNPSRYQQGLALTEATKLVGTTRDLAGPAAANDTAVLDETDRFENSVWKPERLRQAVDVLTRAVEDEAAHKDDPTYGQPTALAAAMEQVEQALANPGAMPDSQVVLARRVMGHMREDITDMHAADENPSEAYRQLRKTAIGNLATRLQALKEHLPHVTPSAATATAPASAPPASSAPALGAPMASRMKPDPSEDLMSDLRVAPSGGTE